MESSSIARTVTQENVSFLKFSTLLQHVERDEKEERGEGKEEIKYTQVCKEKRRVRTGRHRHASVAKSRAPTRPAAYSQAGNA